MDAGYESPPDAAREKTPGIKLKFTPTLPSVPILDFLSRFEGDRWVKKYIVRGYSRLSVMEMQELSNITNIDSPEREDIDYFLVEVLAKMGYTFSAVNEFWHRKGFRLSKKDDENYLRQLYGTAISRLEAWVSSPQPTKVAMKRRMEVPAPQYLTRVLRNISFLTMTGDPCLKKFTEEGRFLYRDKIMDQVLFVHPYSLYQAHLDFCSGHGEDPCTLWNLRGDLRHRTAYYQPWLVGRVKTDRMWESKRCVFNVVVLSRIYLVKRSMWPEQHIEFDPKPVAMVKRGPHSFLRKYPIEKKLKNPLDGKKKTG